MTPQQFIALLNDPQTLFRKAYVVVSGGAGHTGPNGQAGISTFTVTVTDHSEKGFTTGISGFFGRTKDRPKVKVERINGAAKADGALAGNEFNAYYIPMVQLADVGAGQSHYTLPTGAGVQSSLAITSQISGCVFSIGSNAGGAVMASHVQPPNNAALTKDQKQAAAQGAGLGNFANVTQVRKGHEYGDSHFVAIMGALQNGQWQFFQQTFVIGQTAAENRVGSAARFASY